MFPSVNPNPHSTKFGATTPTVKHVTIQARDGRVLHDTAGDEIASKLLRLDSQFPSKEPVIGTDISRRSVHPLGTSEDTFKLQHPQGITSTWTFYNTPAPAAPIKQAVDTAINEVDDYIRITYPKGNQTEAPLSAEDKALFREALQNIDTDELARSIKQTAFEQALTHGDMQPVADGSNKFRFVLNPDAHSEKVRQEAGANLTPGIYRLTGVRTGHPEASLLLVVDRDGHYHFRPFTDAVKNPHTPKPETKHPETWWYLQAGTK